MLSHYYEEKRKNLPVLFNINYKHDGKAVACLRTARIYKVDDETSNIDEFNLDPSIWNEVDKADENEIRQFAEEKAFQKVHRLQITSEMGPSGWSLDQKAEKIPRRNAEAEVKDVRQRVLWPTEGTVDDEVHDGYEAFPKIGGVLPLPGKVYA